MIPSFITIFQHQLKNALQAINSYLCSVIFVGWGFSFLSWLCGKPQNDKNETFFSSLHVAQRKAQQASTSWRRRRCLSRLQVVLVYNVQWLLGIKSRHARLKYQQKKGEIKSISKRLVEGFTRLGGMSCMCLLSFSPPTHSFCAIKLLLLFFLFISIPFRLSLFVLRW